MTQNAGAVSWMTCKGRPQVVSLQEGKGVKHCDQSAFHKISSPSAFPVHGGIVFPRPIVLGRAGGLVQARIDTTSTFNCQLDTL